MRYIFTVALLLGALPAAAQSTGPKPAPRASGTQAIYQAAADSALAKVKHLEQNAAKAAPDQTPTVLTEREINAYLASGEVKLPKGARSLVVAGQPGMLTARSRVDFDAITAGAPSNPLMVLFSGMHDVDATAHASGAGNQAQVHIDSIALDGVVVPRVALEMFVNRYVKPRYPNLGLDSTFKMPERIDTAAIGWHTLTVTQK
jgi:hypothetical protein